VADQVLHPGPAAPRMPRRHYLLVLAQLLWRMRLDLLLMLALCLLVSLPQAGLKRDLITQSGVEATLGIAVSVFLAFRNTQAINRWWEARSLWGVLVNQSRSWRDIVLTLLADRGVSAQKRIQLLRLQVLAVWLLNLELRNVARAPIRQRVLALASQLGFPMAVTVQQVARARSGVIQDLFARGLLSELGRDALLRSVVVFHDAAGGLQKIRNTPLPSAYDAFVRLIAWLFGFELFLDCFVEAQPLIGIALFAGFLTAERIGAYVEGPFDRDPSSLSLPLDQICLGISGDLLAEVNPFAQIATCSDPSVWT